MQHLTITALKHIRQSVSRQTPLTLSGTRLRHIFAPLLLGLLALATLPVQAINDEDLLPPDQAFALSHAVNDDGSISLTWKVAEGYYLYRGRIKLSSEDSQVVLGKPELPSGKVKNDEFFGRIETLRHTVRVRLPIEQRPAEATRFTLKTSSQGCADIGVCYPPQKHKLSIELPALAANTSTDKATQSAHAETTTAPLPKEQIVAKPLSALQSLGKSLDLPDDDQQFLEPDEAFQASVTANGPDSIRANWRIADGYYLYLKRIKFRIKPATGEATNARLGTPNFPAADIKEDPLFGSTKVYHHTLSVDVPVSFSNPAQRKLNLELEYQGCASAGLCYPPQRKQFQLDLGNAPAASSSPATVGPVTANTATSTSGSSNTQESFVSEQDGIASTLASGNTLAAIFWFFLAGLALSLTPCVFPMIPILSSIVVGQGEKTSTARAFVLSLVYVLAMAITYTVAGVLAGLFGANLQAIFQNPWILSSFVAIFVALALSMFGFYELQLPSGLQSRLTQISNSQQGGTLTGVAIMGLLSALIVGPCVAPPLMGALIYIGQSGDALLGGLALFAMAMGMGVPLLIIGTSAGKLVPRAGAWMDTVKAVFGVALLGLGIWMLERIVPAEVSTGLWALLIMVSAIYMGALEGIKQGASGWMRLWKGLGVILLVWGTLMLVGLASGGNSVLQPLAGMGGPAPSASHAEGAHELSFTLIHNSEQLDQHIRKARAAGKGVFVDFYADWCVECKRMEASSFRDSAVIEALANSVLLQADVTDNNAGHQALLKRFRLIGPPAMLFFGPDGKERSNYRVVGYMEPEPFAAHINKAFKAASQGINQGK